MARAVKQVISATPRQAMMRTHSRWFLHHWFDLVLDCGHKRMSAFGYTEAPTHYKCHVCAAPKPDVWVDVPVEDM
jgi:hypothetical protein